MTKIISQNLFLCKKVLSVCTTLHFSDVTAGTLQTHHIDAKLGKAMFHGLQTRIKPFKNFNTKAPTK